MKKLMLSFLLALTAIVVWTPRARADHPVKEIPIRVYRVQPHQSGWTTADHVMRQVEFANRIYASAGIKFTFDPNTGFEDLWDSDLQCWLDDHEDDVDVINLEAQQNFKELAVFVPMLVAPDDGVPCVTSACNITLDCCPYDYELVYKDGQWIYECDNPVSCDTSVNKCFPSGYSAHVLECHDLNCDYLDACTHGVDQGDFGGYYIAFRPLANPGIMTLAHELGHHFGLHHPWDSYGQTWNDGKQRWEPGRCYDEYHTATSGCGPEPASCSGANGSCLADEPWRNIMSYHGLCQSYYGGSYGTSGWNMSLSPDQRAIVDRAVATYWDDDIEHVDDTGFQLGGWERMQAAMSTGAREYRAEDTWSSVFWLPVGESSWTKGNVKIKAADVNGDGRKDLIVSAGSGSHPNTTVWIRSSSGSLSYAQTLVGTGGAAVGVAVGNFTGDGSDDVVVSTSSNSYFFKGAYGASTMTQVATKSWGTGSYKIYTGNFGGQHELPIPMPAIGDYHTHLKHQNGVNIGTYYNLSYADVVLVGSSATLVYYGGSTLDLSTADVTLLATSNVVDIRAANVGGDYHDEMVVQDLSAVAVKKGADSFDWNQQYTSYAFGLGAAVRLSTGDLAGGEPFYGDLLISGPSNTKLYLGAPNGPNQTSVWTNTNVKSTNTQHVTADFIRGGHDDVMFNATWGSYLYAGARGSPYLTGNHWSDTGMTFNSVEWFGTQ